MRYGLKNTIGLKGWIEPIIVMLSVHHTKCLLQVRRESSYTVIAQKWVF